MKFHRLIGSACVLAALNGCVAADDPSAGGDAALDRFLATPAQVQKTIVAAREQMTDAHAACPAATFEPVPGALVLSPVTTRADGVPLSGAWTQDVVFRGCGTPIMQHAFVAVAQDATLPVLMGIPGETQLDIFRQQANLHVIQTAVPAMLGVTCGNVAVVNSVQKGAASDPISRGSDGAVFRENWWLDVCGRHAVAPIDVVFDSSGRTRDAAILSRQAIDQPWS